MAQTRPLRRGTIWRDYRSLGKRTQAGVGCAILLGLLSMCLCTGTSMAQTLTTIFPVTVTPTTVQTAKPTQATVAQVATTVPTLAPTATKPKPTVAPTKEPVPTATPAPTQAPIPTPIPTQAPVPTQPPAPTQPPPTAPPVTGVNGNPWGYNFTPGNVIYSPPSGFCSYFACIANFYNGRGYVEECQDGDYSKSGGISGVCSHHGGALQPLYSH